MEREIKFRAWDKSRMIHFDTLEIGVGDGKKVKPCVFFKNANFEGQVRLGAHEVMQFTGVLDRKGTPIYEKDIVNEIDTLNPHITRHREITFEFGSFCVKDTPINEYYSNTNRSKWFELEVVGNIFETPELLK